MKIPQCYFNMKLSLDQRKAVWLFISVKLKHAKELTYKVLHLCTCMLFIHRKNVILRRMLIKTRLILNDVTLTLSSRVSITARFIKENIKRDLLQI